MTWAGIRGAWNRFFHEPVSPASICVYRAAFGALVFLNCALMAPDWGTWFSESGAVPYEVSQRSVGGLRINLFALWPASDGASLAIFSILTVASLALVAGFVTRTASVLVFLGLVSLHHRNIHVLNSADTFLRVAAFFLMFAPAGAMYSVDRWRNTRAGGGRASPVAPRAPWAQRLIQVQFAIVYVSTFLWKVRGTTWVDGSAVFYALSLEEFRRFPVPAFMLGEWPVRLATWGTLAVELALGTLIWVRELRYWVLAAGAALHLSIDYSMNIPLFQWVMITAGLTFVYPEDVESFIANCRAGAWRLSSSRGR